MAHEEMDMEKNAKLSAGGLSGEERIQSVDPVLARLRAQLGLGHAHLPREAARSVASLIVALQSPEWEVRTAAARGLGFVGEQHEVEQALLAALQCDAVPAVRAAAAYALAERDEAFPEVPLVLALRDDPHAAVRAAAASALATRVERLSSEARQALIQASDPQREQDGSVRAAAIRVLGDLGTHTQVDLLKRALRDSEWLVREEAALAMGRQGDRADVEALEDVLNRGAHDEELDVVCKAAAQALGKIWAVTSALIPMDDVHISVSTDAPTTDQAEAQQEEHPPHEPIRRVSGNVEFDGLEPGDFDQKLQVPIVAQALDNQWVPRTLLQALLRRKIAFSDAEKYLEGLVRTEYMRSLINGERVIINRAYLYNNPVISRDYLRGGTSRSVFKALLAEGTIVPFLLYEHSPNEAPAFGTDPQGFQAWTQLCQEVRTQCLRFSWEEDLQQQELRTFMSRLHEYVQTYQTRDLPRLAKDLGIRTDDIGLLRERLAAMQATSSDHYNQQVEQGKENVHITRNILYQRFVTVGDNPARRIYDPSKPLAGEIKQLLDLAYNGNLASSLNGYLLTPVDSPPRLILQEWNQLLSQQPGFSGQDILKIMSEGSFDVLQQGMYLKSMGMLSLQDVREIRKTDEWLIYIKSLQQLLHQPGLFGALANDVYTNYVKMADRITTLIKERNLQQGGKLERLWDPDVKIITTVGGASLQVIWKGKEIFYTIDDKDREGKDILPSAYRGAAPVSMRMVIGDSPTESAEAGMSTGIDIMKGRMLNAAREWREIVKKVSSDWKIKELSPQRLKTVAVPNLSDDN